jgi:hypothetical protein
MINKMKSPKGKKHIKPKIEVKNASPKRCTLKHIERCEEYPKNFLYNTAKLCKTVADKQNQAIPEHSRPLSRMNKPELCKYIKTNPVLVDTSFKKLKDVRKQMEKLNPEDIPPVYTEYFKKEYQYLGGRLGGTVSMLYLWDRIKKSKNVELISTKSKKSSMITWETDLEKKESRVKVDSVLTKKISNSKKPYSAFFLTLSRLRDSAHSNIIILDNKNKRAYLYDPSSTKHYGRYNVTELNDILDIYFKRIGYKFIATWEYCPVFTISQWFQTQMKALKKKKNLLDPPGFCSVHTLLILDTFSKQNELSFEEFIKTVNKDTTVSIYDLVYRFHSFVTHYVMKRVRKIGYEDENYDHKKVSKFIKDNRKALFKV